MLHEELNKQAPAKTIFFQPVLYRAAAAILLVVAGGATWQWFGRAPVVEVSNQLDAPIMVVKPEGDTVRVPAKGTGRITLSRPGFVRMAWRGAPRLSDAGRQLGMAPEGEIDVLAGRGTIRRVVSLAVTRVPMFEPFVSNATAGPLDVIVNAGLAGAVRCGCVVAPGTRLGIGFYPLYRNTTVRAVRPDGRTATFADLGPKVDRTTWSVGLRFEDRDFR